MALAFDDVIPRLLELGTADPVLSAAKRVAVVRDLTGRLRLALEVEAASDADREALESALTAKLGGWYAAPALYADGPTPQKRMAQEILERAKGRWPSSWPAESVDPIRGTATKIDPTRWGAIQRVLSKETWLSDQEIKSPWNLAEKTPTIVSFYSYKGGVGRSTLVAVVAALLARAGDKVVVIDRDLEAP